MKYRAVGTRCAVIIQDLKLPISDREALRILKQNGFRVIEVDLIALARNCVGQSIYNRGARPSEAPAIVDCSSFTKYLYGQRGIWLPRRSIQQREYGEIVSISDIVGGELVFVSGWINYYYNHPSDGVGHVGIATDQKTVVHAADKTTGIVESPIDKFVEKNRLRGIRRYIPLDRKVITLETPPRREVEITDDLRWIILQSFSPK